MIHDITLEVCVDNIDSVKVVSQLDVDRLELCSALGLEGLTPNNSFVAYAKAHSTCSLQAMIRPRSGDFYYTSDEIKLMCDDIMNMSKLGVDGVVFAALESNNNINIAATKQLIDTAKQHHLQTTFHRAIDMADNYHHAIEQLIALGVQRILSSGQDQSVMAGKKNIQTAQQQYGHQIEIMAGGGINADNVQALLQQTNIRNIHCSASSLMNRYHQNKPSPHTAFPPAAMTFKTTDHQRLKSIIEKIREI